MGKRLYLTLTLLIMALFLAVPTSSQAEISLMDGKLILSGFIKNTSYYRLNGYDREFDRTPGQKDSYNHNTHWDYSHFSALIEGLYTIKEDQESTLRVFGGFKYWYNATVDYDDENARKMYKDDRRDYRSPHRIEELISELYFDYINGPWQVRLGKQIVIWGQLDMSRVADVVNPLDLRFGVPGVDTWEEVKQGLWMIRTFYQSQLPGNLLFEFILNPGYYASFKLPYEGTHWGPEHFKNNPFPNGRDQGFYSWMQNKWFKDEPSTWALSNYEIGGRVQGYTWDIDWSLLVWNALADAPNNVNVTEAQQFNLGYFDVFGKPFPNDLKYSDYGRVYRYKRYTTIGGTAQTFTSFLNTVWRLEWFYEHNSPLVLGINGDTSNLYDNDRAKILGVAVQGNWYLRFPWWTRVVGTGKEATLSLTYFYEKVLNYKKDMCLADRNYKLGKTTVDYFSMFFMQQMFNAALTFTCNTSYYPNLKKLMFVPCFSYMFADSGPFSGFRAELGLKIYNGAKYKYTEQNGVSNALAQKDSVIMRLRYEF